MATYAAVVLITIRELEHRSRLVGLVPRPDPLSLILLLLVYIIVLHFSQLVRTLTKKIIVFNLPLKYFADVSRDLMRIDVNSFLIRNYVYAKTKT